MPATRPTAVRLVEKIEISAGCWMWTGAVGTSGYGRIGVEGGRTAQAHRIAYELWVGPIPEGLHIDHLCRNRLCCRPEHLEPVTQQENNRRAAAARKIFRTKCRYGHTYTGELDSAGRRFCRECRRNCARRSKERLRAARGEAA